MTWCPIIVTYYLLIMRYKIHNCGIVCLIINTLNNILIMNR